MKYNLNLNQGVEAFGTSGKTITATEVVESASSKELAREVAHLAPLVDERTAQYVLDNVLAAATQLMSEGKAVILNLDGKAGLRLYVDVKLKAGSINLAKAKELDPEVTDLTLDNISALAQKAAVSVAVPKPKPNLPCRRRWRRWAYPSPLTRKWSVPTSPASLRVRVRAHPTAVTAATTTTPSSKLRKSPALASR